MIGLIFGETDFPKQILKKIKKKEKYLIVDLTKNKIFKKDKNSYSVSIGQFGKIINNEIFATEIARTIVGSIGLILTVPITTYLAVRFVDKYKHLKNCR